MFPIVLDMGPVQRLLCLPVLRVYYRESVSLIVVLPLGALLLLFLS
jgi:hypothetical protein